MHPFCWQTAYRSSRFRTGWGTRIFPPRQISTPIWITVRNSLQRRRWCAVCRFPKRAISAADGSKTQKKAGNKTKSCSFQIYGKNSPKPGDFWIDHEKRKIQQTRMVTEFLWVYATKKMSAKNENYGFLNAVNQVKHMTGCVNITGPK